MKPANVYIACDQAVTCHMGDGTQFQVPVKAFSLKDFRIRIDVSKVNASAIEVDLGDALISNGYDIKQEEDDTHSTLEEPRVTITERSGAFEPDASPEVPDPRTLEECRKDDDAIFDDLYESDPQPPDDRTVKRQWTPYELPKLEGVTVQDLEHYFDLFKLFHVDAPETPAQFLARYGHDWKGADRDRHVSKRDILAFIQRVYDIPYSHLNRNVLDGLTESLTESGGLEEMPRRTRRFNRPRQKYEEINTQLNARRLFLVYRNREIPWYEVRSKVPGGVDEHHSDCIHRDGNTYVLLLRTPKRKTIVISSLDIDGAQPEVYKIKDPSRGEPANMNHIRETMCCLR